MANQVTVTNNTINVAVTATPNVDVTISRTAIGTVANVASANYANYAGNALVANVANFTLTSNYANFAGNALSVDGANVVGEVANAAYANAADLANLAAVANLAFSVSGANVVGAVANANYATIAGTAYSVDAANISGIVANANYAAQAGSANTAGTVTNATQSNITALGTLTGLSINGSITGNLIPAANVTYNLGNATRAWKDLYLSGNTIYLDSQTITADANGITMSGNIAGDGAGLYDLNAANIVGTVANANYSASAGQANTANLATYATTANAVAGANVSGIVANATYADSANTANLATYATTANSVAGANVSGTVANATYANSANLANTVTQANQPNITSLGNLTALVVSSDATVAGNLTVGGNIQYSNITQLYITDPIIEMGGGPNGAPLTANDGKDRGSFMYYFTTQPEQAFMGWDSSNGEFALASQSTIANDVVTINTLGNLRVNNVVGNLLGTANIANVAYSVSGANVSGAVANATYAESANTANLATYATTANAVAGANVSGEVANANYATFAGTAYSVSGGNVSGEVANANYASYANIANLATYATTANAVAGANVSGIVANANHAAYANLANIANVAYSVAVGNVVGIGNIATVNLDGNASNALLGNGTWGPVESANANYANFAGQVTNSAQPNITSVGTLTGLTVNGQSNLGNVGNVKVTGGSSGYLLSTDGTGNLNWVIPPSTSLLSNGTSNISIAANGNITTTVAGVLATSVTLPGNVPTFNVDGHIVSERLVVLGGTSNSDVAPIGMSQTWNNSAIDFESFEVITSNIASGANSKLINLRLGPNSTAATSKFYVDRAGNVVFTGVITGDGSGLSNVTVGSVANANYANFAGTAYSVSGSNVVGAVANALYANAANTANLATYATTANAVAGANVTGTVANATYAVSADTANSATIAATANSVAGANVSGQVANALVAGTVYTNAQPNITSVGTLTSLSVSGNVSGGNISTTGVITGNGSVPTGGAADTYLVKNTAANYDYSWTDRVNAKTIYENVKNVSGTTLAKGTPVYQIGVTGNTITVGAARADDPAKLAVGVLDVTLADQAEGRMLVLGEIKGVNTAGFISGERVYLGATGGYTNVAPTLSNVAIQFLGVVNRVDTNNGSGFITGTLTPDAVKYDGYAQVWTGTAWVPATELSSDTTPVLGGNLNANSFSIANANNITAVTFTGNGSGLTNIAGANVTGTVANATYAESANTANSATIAGSANSVAVANVTGIGNIATINLNGNASTILDGTGAWVTAPSSANANYANFAGDVVNSAQPNITSVGTLASLDVTANITAGNVYANTGLIRGNLIQGTLTTASQPNITTIGTLTGLNATGNVAFGANLTVNRNITSNIGNIIAANGHIFANVGNVQANLFVGNGSGLTNIAVANIDGLGNIATTNYNGNGSTVLAGNGAWIVPTGGTGSPGGSNTQLQFNDAGAFNGIPNVTWNGSNLSLGNIANVKVGGGSNNEVIRTDGSGNLSFTSIALDLLVGTRTGPYTVPITNYTFQVETRSSGNVTVYVN